MKKLSVFLSSMLFVFATLFVNTTSYASHILAMDLYYTWVSGNTYQITAVIYGDCAQIGGQPFQGLSTATPQICVFRGNNNVATIALNLLPPTTGFDITPVCGANVGQTQCEDPNSTIPGIMRFIYTANYTLPTPSVSSAWRFAFFGDMGNNTQAGRSAAITNIQNAGQTIMELVDTLDNTAGGHNSNAAFSVIPTPFFCLNKADTYNPGAVSSDRDSLSVIQLVDAMDAGVGMGGPQQCQFGSPVNYSGVAWNPPFTPISAQTPLTVDPGSFSYDARTGQLNFTPDQIQRSTVVYNVREFRAGSFVGSCQREMNFLVLNCNSVGPSGGIAGVTNGTIVDSSHIVACANGGAFSFYFDPREPGTSNTITVDTAGIPPGAVVTITGNGTATPHVVFSWNAAGATPGTYIYYLTYTDDDCPLKNTNTTAISVTISPSPTITYTITSPITCTPKEAINIIPGGTGSPWTVTVKGTTPHTFTGVTGSFIDSLTPGIDTISIASSSGANICDSSLIIVVPSVAITGDSIICVGARTIFSDAMAGGSWSTANTALATVIATGTAAGTVTGVAAGIATITYTFPNSCFKTTTVTVKPLPATITGNTHICTGLTTTLSDATPGGTWSSTKPSVATVGSLSGVVTGVTANVDSIIYTASGCAISTTVVVNTQPSFTSGSPNICTDGTTTLVATPGGGTWSNTNTDVATITLVGPDKAIITGVHSNGATVIAYTLSGCTLVQTISAVSVLPFIVGPNKVCTGQSVVLSDSVTGGTWTTANTNLALVDAPSGTVSGIAPGVPRIMYSIGGSCFTTATITVNQSPNHGAITGLSDLCIGFTVSLSDTISGGTWHVTNDSASVSGHLVTGVHAGRDTVLYVVSNPQCIDTATMPIRIYAVPDSGTISGPHAVCVGHLITLADTAPGGAWSSALTNIATVASTASGIVTGISAGADTIRYATSNPGCTTVARYAVNVYDPPVVGPITGIAKVCAGAAFPMSDTASNGVWSSTNVAVATVNSVTGEVKALSQGMTTISYTVGPNLGGCATAATFTLTVSPKNTLIINNTVSQVTCNGDNNGSISVAVTGGTPPVSFTYLWSNGNTTNLLSGLVPATYTLTVTEPSTLCIATDSVTIIQPDSLRVVAEMTQDKCKTGSGKVTTTVTGGTPAYTYHWSDNSMGSDLENLHAGTYSVMVTDQNNCEQSLSVDVTDNDCIITVHDVLTPNGDGFNDIWLIEGIENYTSSTVQLFDKWGDIVFEKTNYNNDWSGKGKNGADVPDGTYFYVIKLNAINLLGGKNTFTGAILIKR